MSTKPHEDIQKLAYKALNDFFDAHQDEAVEIEILPAAIQPPNGLIMEDGVNLGISKKILAAAYLEARQQFFAGARNSLDATVSFQASRVILLFDPEHITAANHRKRRLAALRSGEGSEKGLEYHVELQRELHFLNSILTSPLHRQSKSPTLWYHRLWIMESFKPLELQFATDERILAFWTAEFHAICKSGEQHPKNYYAWQYARRLVSMMDGSLVADEVVPMIKEWCLKHPSDISGWSFLWHICSAMRPVPRHNLLHKVLSYAIDLKAEQESLWVFLRVAITYEIHSGPRLDFYQILEYYSKELSITDGGTSLQSRVSDTLQWIDKNTPETNE